MTEQLANLAQTTLAAPIGAPAAGTSEVIQVRSAAGFPTEPVFRVNLGSGELGKVTAVSGVEWTVERGAEQTVPVVHGAGQAILGVLTKGAVEAGACLTPSVVSRSQVPEIYGSWHGMSYTATPQENSEALQAAFNEAKNVSIFSLGRGACIRLPPGILELLKEVKDEGVGTRLCGGSEYSSVLRAATGFEGEMLIHAQQEGASVNTSHSYEDFSVDMNNQAAHGLTLYKGYDAIYWKNVSVKNVNKMWSGIRCVPDPKFENKVSQTFKWDNVWAAHADDTATADTILMEYCQEAVLDGCKAWGGQTGEAETATAAPWHFKDCRGVATYGCSAANTAGAAILVTTENQKSIGLNFNGTTFEAVKKMLVAEGASTLEIEELTLAAPRIQGTVGPIELKYVAHSDLQTRAQEVTIASTCAQVHIHTENIAKVTDAGANTTILQNATAESGNDEYRVYPNLGVYGLASPTVTWKVKGFADFWGWVFSANEKEEFGFLLRRWTSPTTPTTILSVSTTTVEALTTNLSVGTAGKGLRVKEGSNAKQGVATLVAGKVVVSNTSITATSRIFITCQELGTVTIASAYAVAKREVGKGFEIVASQITDTSIVAYQIFEPA